MSHSPKPSPAAGRVPTMNPIWTPEDIRQDLIDRASDLIDSAISAVRFRTKSPIPGSELEDWIADAARWKCDLGQLRVQSALAEYRRITRSANAVTPLTLFES